ncbi:MAG: hypothetical protein IT220_03205 [Flavobacteriaceae bacterium]|nr:hypothetical protein [Flavobacteriaceae bacterium]
MSRLIAKDLKIKFIETLNEINDFSYEEGNPFLIKIEKKKYFVFLKNLSPACFKNSPDISRIQLPYSEHFSKVFNDDIPFIILGYDVENDIVVSWNPKKVKDRLNTKSNVSLYSRYSLQENVKGNEFKLGYLSNGEKIVLFKRDNLISFFNLVHELFKGQYEINEHLSVKLSEESTIEYSLNKLIEITDKLLLQKVTPLLHKNQVLQAVEIVSTFYDGKFKDMTFKDWYKLVNLLYKKIKSTE